MTSEGPGVEEYLVDEEAGALRRDFGSFKHSFDVLSMHVVLHIRHSFEILRKILTDIPLVRPGEKSLRVESEAEKEGGGGD